MSSFRDTFTREDEENLQYDDVAFYYFFSTMLIIIMLPLVYSTWGQIFHRKPVINPKFPKSQKVCNLNLVSYISHKEKLSGINFKLFIKITLIVIMSAFLYQSMEKAGSSQPMKSFDPYETLDVPRDANETIIKRAFRRMSVKYHPDKNPDDPEATARFLLIKKAYDCLTDPEARVNCEKYGNPDGQGSFNVAIALPSALLRKENHVKVLAIFFFVLVIIVPSIVLCWYSESKKYDTDGMLVDNKRIFYQFLNENLIAKNIPRIISTCVDFIPIHPLRPEQGPDFKKLNQSVTDIMGKPNMDIRLYKPHHLLCAYMNDIKLRKTLMADLAFMLERIPKLLEGITQFAMTLSMMPPRNKTFGLRCCSALIEFSQHFYQGMWMQDSSLLQLRCLDKDTINRITKKVRKLPAFSEIVRATQEEAKTFNFIPDENRDQFEKEVKNFPNIRVEHQVVTKNESEIVLGDVMSIQFKLIRENENAKDKEFYYCYSHKFPLAKKEKWIIIIADEEKNRLIMHKSTTSGKKIVEDKFEFPVAFFIQAEGPIHWKLYIKSDCYRGLDQEFDLKFYVHHPKNIKRDDIKLNNEDEKVLREPSLFAKMMNPALGEEDSDDELEEDEDPKNKKKSKKAVNEDEELEEEEEEETQIKS